MLILLEVSQLMDVIRGLGEVGEGSHQVAGVEAESHPEVLYDIFLVHGQFLQTILRTVESRQDWCPVAHPSLSVFR